MSAFIDAHRERFGVEPICRTLDVSASAYYQRATGERSERSIEDERLLGRIREVHATNYECYGYPRVWHELQRQGERVGRDHVARLMRQEGICGRQKKRYRVVTTDSKHDQPIAPNLLVDAPVATGPNQIWVADITYVATAQNWV